MKMQTSLEFMLVLGSVSLLILISIVAYRNSTAGSYSILSSFLNGSNSSIKTHANATADGPAGQGEIYMSAYMPANSTEYQQSRIEAAFYGCAKGTVSIELASNTMELPSNSTTLPVTNIAVYQGTFIPMAPGKNKLTLNYTATCGNRTNTTSVEFYTYTALPTASSGNQSGAYIYTKSEAEKYPLSITPVYGTSEWSHCAYADPIAGIYPIGIQCGTTNAWGYMVFSDICYWSSSSMYEYYCITNTNTGYSLGDVINTNVSYLYNISLTIHSPYVELVSNITSASGHAGVYLLGKPVGNASVKTVTGMSDIGNEALLLGEGKNGSVNYTTYQQYVQSREAMLNMLSYYNNTVVSASTRSSIQQSIASFDKWSSLLTSAAVSPWACQLLNGYAVCNSSLPFSYYIIANVSVPGGIGNTTLYTGGSSVQVINR